MEFKEKETSEILEYINGCTRVKECTNLEHFSSAVDEVESRSKLLAIPYRANDKTEIL